MKALIYTMFFSLVNTLVFSNNPYSTWNFGGGIKFDFTNTVGGYPTVSLNNNAVEYAPALQCDTSNGEIILYTDGASVLGKNFNVIGNNILKGTSENFQPAIIVPVSGNPDKYYIFDNGASHSGVPSNPYAEAYPHYSMIDLSLNSGMGGIVPGISNIVLPDSIEANDYITAVAHQNGTDFWVIINEYDTKGFYAYRVAPDSVYPAVYSFLGPQGLKVELGVALKASPKGDKLISFHLSGLIYPKIQIMNFDNATGAISFLAKESISYLSTAVSFSPDGNLFYFGQRDGGSISALYQYDLNAPDIIASKLRIGDLSQAGTAPMGIQIGPDAKLYILNNIGSLSIIDVVSCPNIKGLGCGLTTNILGTINKAALLFPNLISAFLYNNQIDTTAITGNIGYNGSCGNYSLTSTLNIIPDNYYWDFGDSTYSDESIPIHTYKNAGVYYVSLYVNKGCTDAIFFDTVTVQPFAKADLGADIRICTGDSAVLTVYDPVIQSYFWLPDGSSSAEIIVSQSGTYIVSVTDSNMCESSDTIVVSADLEIKSKFMHTVFDNLNVQYEATVDAVSYLWDFGDELTDSNANPFHTYSDPGMYTVCLTTVNACGSFKNCDTVDIFFSGINNILNNESAINIYPNPAKEGSELYVNIPNNSSDQFYYSIYNISGSEILQSGILLINNRISIEKDIPVGIYILELYTPSQRLVHHKLIIY